MYHGRMANHSEELRALQKKITERADGLVDTDPIALRDLAYQAARALGRAAAREEAVREVLNRADRENAAHLYPDEIEEALDL